MQPDLSAYHEPISDLFVPPVDRQGWDRYRLSEEQIRFFNENGYLAGIRILDDGQVERLREELIDLMNPDHPARQLYYEFHSNESKDPTKILFHALGAWRIKPAFTTFFGIRPSQSRLTTPGRRGAILARPVVLQAGVTRRRWSRGIRTIPTGRARLRWRT